MTDKGKQPDFSFETVAVLCSALLSSNMTISSKQYELMSALDGTRTACAYQHQFRSVLKRAKELKAETEGGKKITPVEGKPKGKGAGKTATERDAKPKKRGEEHCSPDWAGILIRAGRPAAAVEVSENPSNGNCPIVKPEVSLGASEVGESASKRTKVEDVFEAFTNGL
ncbi:hypothetical protein ANO11243_089840 [Dothideomycetidae sp. 11243]|nr:hypothetical protein ANO11243_089840 [fungal sp. No.11243]